MVLAYNRMAPPQLMNALVPGGWAHSLVEYGRAGQFALDLQLRGYDGKAGHWATLYVGLTKVLDLHFRPSVGFRLDAHPVYRAKKLGWSDGWKKSQPAERLAARWADVENYLERAIPAIGARYLREGAVQSAISGFASENMVVVDREAAITFGSAQEKQQVTKALSRPLLDAVEAPDGPAWLQKRPKSLGGECDALAVTDEGDILTIEVKPASATSTIPWAPLQVRHYANLFSAWAVQTRKAGEVIQAMVHQRVQLGLARDVRRLIERPIRVQPMIAISRGYSPKAIQRLAEVEQRLADAGLNDPPLKVASVTLAGRLDPIDLASL